MAGYIGSKASVVSSGAEHKKLFNITTTTTSLTGLVYTPTLVHVFHNGVRLVDGTDYTATTGTSITLTVAAENGDQVAVISYATFQTSDTVSASAGGTFGNSVTMSSGAVVNRTGDGTIIDLQSSGTTVGSIGSNSGTNMIMGTGATGIYFNNASQSVHPWNISDNQARNGAIDLGRATDQFRYLYLNGGVVFNVAGGTGTSTSGTLDDYEEGTFTPTFQSVTNPTYVVQVGYYIKIGSFVSYQYRIEWTGTSVGSTINGLPFTARNGQDEYPMTSNVYHDQSVTYSGSRTTAIGYVLKNTTSMDLACIGSAQTVGSLTFSTSGSIYVTGQYYTNA